MRVLYRQVPVKLEKSFNVRRDVRSPFKGSGHYHPELELHYVVKGEGVRFIGDTRSLFSQGELVLVGPNLPHSWRSIDDCPKAGDPIEVIVLNFIPEFLGKQFLQLPETIHINRLLQRSGVGLEFYGSTKHKVSELLMAVTEVDGFDRIVIFLQILHLLAQSNECRSIAKGRDMLFQPNESDAKRMNIVTQYSLANYMRDISLEEISSVVNLSETSFCRYFKTITTQTYFDFLIELRVSFACRELLENRNSIEVICFNCGFRNVSNFYRHFKKVMGMTPQEYRKKFVFGAA